MKSSRANRDGLPDPEEVPSFSPVSLMAAVTVAGGGAYAFATLLLSEV